MSRGPPDEDDRGFAEEVGRKERRLLEARGTGPGKNLSWIGTLGVVGWCVTVPMLAGIALGRWLDSTFKGSHSFTIMLLVGGLFLGCAIAWSWVKKRLELGDGKAPTDEGGGPGRARSRRDDSEESDESPNR